MTHITLVPVKKRGKMETYRGEEVKGSMTARLYPADNTVPECQCVLRITPMHLFVSEDNFDGTYEDHYILAHNMIEEIKVSAPYKKSVTLKEDMNPDKGSFGSGKWAVTSVLERILRVNRGNVTNGSEKGIANKKLLEIVFLDDKFERQHIYFDEISKNSDTFIKLYNKAKES